MDAVVEKVNKRRITNSKDLRKLRPILRDPVAREHFLSEDGEIESAILQIPAPEKGSKPELIAELDAAMEAVRHVSWTALRELRGNEDAIRRISDAEALLKSLREALTS